MEKIERFKYEPPKQEVVPEKLELPPVDTKDEQDYIDTLERLIYKYRLIAEQARYLEGIVDKEMQDVYVKFDPKEFPEVYAALKRKFPDADHTVMTYQQYKTLMELKYDMVEGGVY